MESAEFQAVHNIKKQMDTLMGCHDLASEIKAHEIGKAHDRYLLFANGLKSDQSVKSKSILEPRNISSPESTTFAPDNMEPHDSSLDVEQSSKLPPGNPDIEQKLRTQNGMNYPTKRTKYSPLYLLCYQQHQ